jgi:hypothetical protein
VTTTRRREMREWMVIGVGSGVILVFGLLLALPVDAAPCDGSPLLCMSLIEEVRDPSTVPRNVRVDCSSQPCVIRAEVMRVKYFLRVDGPTAGSLVQQVRTCIEEAVREGLVDGVVKGILRDGSSGISAATETAKTYLFGCLKKSVAVPLESISVKIVGESMWKDELL